MLYFTHCKIFWSAQITTSNPKIPWCKSVESVVRHPSAKMQRSKISDLYSVCYLHRWPQTPDPTLMLTASFVLERQTHAHTKSLANESRQMDKKTPCWLCTHKNYMVRLQVSISKVTVLTGFHQQHSSFTTAHQPNPRIKTSWFYVICYSKVDGVFH